MTLIRLLSAMVEIGFGCLGAALLEVLVGVGQLAETKTNISLILG